MFEEEEANELLPHHPIDCAIELLPKGKLYSMSQVEQEDLHKFIEKNLTWGFICPANSPHAASVLFVKKKDRKLETVHGL